jgi:hypothetical protein
MVHIGSGLQKLLLKFPVDFADVIATPAPPEAVSPPEGQSQPKLTSNAIPELPIWRVPTVVLPGAQAIYHAASPAQVHFFNSIFFAAKQQQQPSSGSGTGSHIQALPGHPDLPWRFGHLWTPRMPAAPATEQWEATGAVQAPTVSSPVHHGVGQCEAGKATSLHRVLPKMPYSKCTAYLPKDNLHATARHHTSHQMAPSPSPLHTCTHTGWCGGGGDPGLPPP